MMCTPTNTHIKDKIDTSIGTNITVIDFDKDSLWSNPSSVPANCTEQTSQVFVQYTCEQSKD